MKKLFTLLCFAALVGSASAQSYRAIETPINGKLTPAPTTVKPNLHHSTNRSASTEILLDYDGNDQQFAGDNGYDYTGYLWGVNSKYANSDRLTLRYAATFFDTLQYIDDNNLITYIPRSKAALTVDSFGVVFVHEHNTGAGSYDTIQFTLYDRSQAVVTGYGTPGATFTTPSLWDTVISTNTTIPLNTTNYTMATFFPNISLAQGKTFGIRVDFKGDTANKFNVIAGFRDDCAASCASEISVAGNNSAYYLNMTQNNQNLSGYFENKGQGAIYYDCDQSNGYTPGACENFYIQNFWMFAYVTAQVDYGVAISADSLKGCPGTVLNLTANAFGSNDLPYTYQWAATNGTLTNTSDQTIGLVLGNSGNAVVTVTVTDANSISTTSSVTVSNKAISVNITNSNPVTLTCGSSVTLTTQISGTTTGKNYTWNTGATGSNQATLQVTTTGNYSVTVTNNSGCSASASIAVQYPGGLSNSVSFTSPPAPLCQNRELTFTNTSARTTGWTPQWTFGDNNVGFALDGKNTYANPGVYQVQLQMDSAGCIFKSSLVNITVLASSNAACVSGIEDVTFANNVSLLPNPSNGNVNITINGAEKNVSIHVYNVIGSEVKAFNIHETTSVFNRNFDFSDLSNGTYLVKIQSNSKIAVKRLTINK